MDSSIRTSKVYDVQNFEKLIDGIQVAACMISDAPPVVDEASVVRRAGALTLGVGSGNACSSCGEGPFSSRLLQTQHYRGRWHTLNLRRRLLGKTPLKAEEFQAREDGASSSSSSESDTDSDEAVKKGAGEVSELFMAATRHCRAYFTNRSGQVLSVYRCLLHHKKECIGGDGLGERWVSACRGLLHTGGWAVFMSAGGHFAGAIFRGESGLPIKHKTFHSYVTRRGQGKAQGTRDNRGSAPRSAGASLRRYNQEQFAQHVKDLLTSWKEDLEMCSLVLYRAVGPLNQGALFGAGSPLRKSDPRLRSLPFPTRRPSHREVLRAHSVLSTVEIYETPEIFQKTIGAANNAGNNNSNDKNNARNARPQKTSPVKLDRAKSREVAAREIPEGPPMSSEDETPSFQPSTCPQNWTQTLSEYDKSIKKPSKDILKHDSDEDSTPTVKKVTKVLNKLDLMGTLEEFDDSVKKKNKKPKKKPQDKQKSAETKLVPEKGSDEVAKVVEESGKPKKGGKAVAKIPAIVEKLWESVKSGDQALAVLLDRWEGPPGLEDSLNTPDPADGNTALHKAAIAEQPDVVRQLLLLGADPCSRNQLLQTPYSSTTHPETRIAFRLFQGLHPDKYNYAKANIPGPLTLEILEQDKEKKAAQKKAKRQKDKEKLQEKIKVSKFMELNDVQKIAAVSERRCFSCGTGLDPKPFQYEDFKFCSIKCLQNHRNTRPLKLSAQ